MVEIQFVEKENSEIVVVSESADGEKHDFFYIRRKGVDTKFTYSGHGQSSYPVDPFEEESNVRQQLGEEVEKALLDEGYPIRPAFLKSSSTRSSTGKIRIHYGSRVHEHSFHTHSGMVEVYAKDLQDERLQDLEEGDFRVQVSDDSEDQVEAFVTYCGERPHEFAVREAVRVPFTFSSMYEEYPEIEIVEWDEV